MLFERKEHIKHSSFLQLKQNQAHKTKTLKLTSPNTALLIITQCIWVYLVVVQRCQLQKYTTTVYNSHI